MLATVIIYTYDRRKYILDALASADQQTLPRDSYEIIVVKGYSDEAIDAEISGKADVSMIVDEKAHGRKLAPAIRKARGDVLFILDDDDLFEENKLEVMVNRFRSDHDLIFAHHSISRINDNGDATGEEEAVPPGEIEMNTSHITRGKISSMLKYRGNWYSSCMAFKREALLPHLGYIEKVDQSVDPFLFFAVLRSSGKMLLLPDRLTRYRVHESTTNYDVRYEDFITRKVEFYRNTLRIYGMALEMCKSTPAEKVVQASITHIETIEAFLSPESGRGKAFRASLRLIGTFQVIFTKYVAIWALLALFKSVAGERAVRMYYKSSTPGSVKTGEISS